VALDTAPTVRFADDGTVSGDTGCNTFSGGYTADGQTLDVGPLASTRRACSPESVMDQEAAILAALDSATTWTTTAQGVDLANAEGMTVLGLQPAG
jgi:heat shock protein HslJ